MENKYVYVVVSQTGTGISRVIQKLTKEKYCHSSISLDASLLTMYSFGRRYKNTPLFGGFIRESIREGVFQRYPNTEIVVLRFLIEENKYNELQSYLESTYQDKKRYGYNYLGAFFALFHKKVRRKRKRYCSEFVRETLLKFAICQENELPEVVRPMDFLSIFADKVIYQGDLQEYCAI